MKYAQQSNSPDWFQSDESKIYEQATSGSSPFNEWYEFDDREDALEMIGDVFNSQSFHDRFVWVDGEVYGVDEFAPDDNSPGYVLKDGAEVAPLGEMIAAESKF